MDANKIYEDIVYLLYNTLGQERLRYELYKDPKYRELYINLVNDLLTMEKDNESSFNDQTWSTTFGKAIVVVSQQKVRIEKQENKTVESIYEDYSKLIAYSKNEFDIKRDLLTANKIKFSKEDVLFGINLSDDIIKKYDDEALEKEKAEQAKTFVNDNPKKNPDNQSENVNNAGFNPFMGQPNGQSYEQAAQNMPVPPMQDSRFYPYSSKPKYMPILKWVTGIVAIVTAVFLIISSAIALAPSINMSKDAGSLSTLPLVTDNPGPFSDDQWKKWVNDGHGKLTAINYDFAVWFGPKATFGNIIVYIFYAIPAAYVGYVCFKKPRNLSEKYRISYWPIVFMIIFYALSIADTYNYASMGQLESVWKKAITGWVGDKADFNTWWDSIVSSKHLQAITILDDISLALICISVILGVVIIIINPKIDRLKYQKAMTEYQKCVMSLMQGIPYEMDQSIYENDDDVIIRDKSKFAIWCEKTWDKMAFWKHKKNKKSKKNKDK